MTNRKYSFKNTNTFEAGLSDHHHMIYTMLKSTFEKAEPIKLTYRGYKNFSFDRFKADLENALKSCPNAYDCFEKCFPSKHNEYAPRKTKCVKGNNKSHLNKFLRRAIMKRSKLKNKTNKTKYPVDIKIYKKKNYLAGSNKQAKFEYFNNLDCKRDTKPFWDRCKPYFSNKHSRRDTNIILKENGESLLKNDVIALKLTKGLYLINCLSTCKNF